MERVRKNVQVSTRIAEWYEKEAAQLGIAQSQLMVVALNEYIKYQESKQIIEDIKKIMDYTEKNKPKTTE